jgi:hypothetical protein
VSCDNEYVHFAVVVALPPTAWRFGKDPIFVETVLNKITFYAIFKGFDSDTTIIVLMAHLRAGSERAAKIAPSTYSSCRDTIRTPILD